MEHPIISILIKVTIFTLMLSLGVNQSFEQLRSLWSRPGSLLRSLLSVVFMFPLLVFILLRVFALSPEVTTGLAVLAAVPGAPMTYKRTAMAGGQPIYSASLQLTLA
jgi:BASS family bile acid:Na+ symporter